MFETIGFNYIPYFWNKVYNLLLLNYTFKEKKKKKTGKVFNYIILYFSSKGIYIYIYRFFVDGTP